MKKFWSKSVVIAVTTILSLSSHGDAPQRIEIVASRYSFTPSSISLRKGVPVVLVLRTSDVTHGLEIKELGFNVKIPKGKSIEASLNPTRAGNFQGKCSHFCGVGHGKMILTVTVSE